jgi:hypothetical protein
MTIIIGLLIVLCIGGACLVLGLCGLSAVNRHDGFTCGKCPLHIHAEGEVNDGDCELFWWGPHDDATACQFTLKQMCAMQADLRDDGLAAAIKARVGGASA